MSIKSSIATSSANSSLITPETINDFSAGRQRNLLSHLVSARFSAFSMLAMKCIILLIHALQLVLERLVARRRLYLL